MTPYGEIELGQHLNVVNIGTKQLPVPISILPVWSISVFIWGSLDIIKISLSWICIEIPHLILPPFPSWNNEFNLYKGLLILPSMTFDLMLLFQNLSAFAQQRRLLGAYMTKEYVTSTLQIWFTVLSGRHDRIYYLTNSAGSKLNELHFWMELEKWDINGKAVSLEHRIHSQSPLIFYTSIKNKPRIIDLTKSAIALSHI